MAEQAASSVPAWSTPTEACGLMLRGVTFRTGSRVALVVGTVLTLVNQGSVIFGGDASAVTWIRGAVNYLVPVVVASIGYLAPFRLRQPGSRG